MVPSIAIATAKEGTAGSAEFAFKSSAFPGCRGMCKSGTEFAHVGVSMLTVELTSHVGKSTSAAKRCKQVAWLSLWLGPQYLQARPLLGS